jgi:hypothetical protein
LVSPPSCRHVWLDIHILIINEPMKGIEPPTCRLQISCSGQLSYIGILKNGRFMRIIPSKIGLQM